MLSYELCSALKKAGFPQDKSLYFWRTLGGSAPMKCNRLPSNVIESGVGYYDSDSPSLEDLLQELGDVGIQIWRDEREWKGGHPALQKNTDSVYRGVGGQTPEEVLAHLYLALHE